MKFCAILLTSILCLGAQDPVNEFPKVNFRGDAFDGFVEVKEQPYIMTAQTLIPNGEMATIMINIDYIHQFVRYEDKKKKDYSCYVYMEGRDSPLLIRMEYDKLKSLIRKAADRG